ncbi:MAG: tautomerase family protein [Pseudomonadota bacterium]|nr:tautomerase family protein [Pseudomonadota bacterium]
MPHVAIKMYPGHNDAEKQELADRITALIAETLGHGAHSVSVGIEDVSPSKWMNSVYAPEIKAKEKTLFKRPGYGPLA